MLQQMQDFTFKHSEQQDAIYTQYTAQQIKALFDSRGDELRIALNLLINALNSTDGAGHIGTSTIQDVDGSTIQEMLKSIRDKLKSKTDGSSGADYVNATPIDGLVGENVQSLLKALKALTDSNKTSLESTINSTKINLEQKINGIQAVNVLADPIAVGSGNNVQAQLAWLLSQIAVAATGSIPDGSLGEAKLTQALVDKINKALTNTGVLTTLLTDDKSSAVNAINEVKTEVVSHLADYVKHPADGGTTAGTATAYTCNSSPNPTELSDKMGVVITAHLDSGANPTLKWGSLAAKSIKKPNGSAANLKKDGLYTLRYNLVNDSFILQGEGPSGNAIASDLLSGKTASTDAGEIVGTMPNRGTFNLALGASVPAGYYSGGSVPKGARVKEGTGTIGAGQTLNIDVGFKAASVLVFTDYNNTICMGGLFTRIDGAVVFNGLQQDANIKITAIGNTNFSFYHNYGRTTTFKYYATEYIQ